VIDLVEHLDGVDFITACATLANDPPPKVKPNDTVIDPKPRFICAYDYVDEAGKLLFQVLRYEPKSFKQRQANGDWNLKDVRRVLYNLPGVIEAAANEYGICIVEGEEDVKILLANNIPATTCPGGAGKWRDEYNEYLRGRRRYSDRR
jgi:putative DNA primase/helicase